MTSTSRIDPSTLGWVKAEIDETLKQARLALESFAENSSDNAQLRFCVTYLHQVVGTLQMVELDGAALLAKETETLAEAVVNEKVPGEPRVYELLTRAILSLPDYLARLQFGQPDAPLRLLPIINELRETRKVVPLTPIELFSPDLSIRPPRSKDKPQGTPEAFPEAAKRLRPVFQAALLNWLRNADDNVHLSKASEVLEELQAAADSAVVEQLFWVARGLVAALVNGDLEPENERKKLLARLEQQIKHLAEKAEKSAIRSSCESLVKAMLFELAYAKSIDARVTQLKETFELDALVGNASPGEENVEAPAPHVVESVAAALGKEVQAAQDILSVFFDSSREDVGNLVPLVNLLEKMSSTLEMLAAPALKTLVEELIETARAIVDSRLQPSDDVSMHMASALLLLEHSSKEVHLSGTAWKKQIDERIILLRGLRESDVAVPLDGIEISETALSDVEFKQLLKVVAAEIRVNLVKVEESLEAFAASPEETAHIDHVPQHLTQIQGALQILGQERAAQLCEVTNQYIEDIRAKRVRPDHSIFDALAISVGTIEVYLEGLERDRSNLESLIDAALLELRQTVGDEGSLVGRAVPPAKSEAAAGLGQEGASDAVSAPGEAEKFEDLDEEIMQIFIEDAKEVYQVIERALEQWLANPEDRDALLELRRGYHTLKGSGRMVGASEIAELAWSVESLLNQIREGKTDPSEAIFTLLFDVKDALPSLISRLEGGPTPAVDVASLRAKANALGSASANPALQKSAPASDSTPTAPGSTNSASSAAGGPMIAAIDQQPPQPQGGIDSALLQIFSAEASGHVATINDFVKQGPGGRVSQTLLRAAHTLQGNARSLRLLPMAEACWEMEKFLHAYDVRQMPLDQSVLDLCRDLGESVATLLELFNKGESLTPALQQRFSGIALSFVHRLDRLLVAEAAEEAAATIEAVDVSGTKSISPDATPHSIFPAVADSEAATFLDAVPSDGGVVQDDAPAETIDPELLEIFQEEAVDILESIEEALTQWRSDRSDKKAVQSLKRSLHTLKGGARMAGAMMMGNISHNAESLLRHVEEGKATPNAELLELLDEVHDALVVMLKQLDRRKPIGKEAGALNAKVLAWLSGKPQAQAKPHGQADAPTEIVASSASPTLSEKTTRRDEPKASQPVEDIKQQPQAMAPTADSEPTYTAEYGEDEDAGEEDDATFGARKERREHIKVRTALLNDLVNYAGEVSIARSRMEQQIFGLREHLAELNRNVARFREQIRELEIQSDAQILYRNEQQDASQPDFDPLEFDRYSRLQQLSRGLAESVHDLSTLQITLDNFVGEAETVLQQQARVNTDLQEGLMRTRMINFSTQAGRLRHIVRQTSRELGKRAELHITGTEVEVDRNVLERMVGPFEHMIRNAIDHGLESEQERNRLKKPAVGKITIHTSHEGSEIVIRFSDDGSGLNVAAIRKKAVDRGLASAEANLSDEEIMQFILLPGFSTAQKVTHLSGRGVGMDVVHNEVKQLGGSITVDTLPAVGTTFIVRLPLTLSITQALLIYVGEQVFAVPLASVVNILEVPVERLKNMSMGEKPLFHHEDQVYPFMHLGARLDLPSAPRNTRKIPVLVAKSGNRHIAIQIDGLAGTREVVIKSLGAQLSEIKGLAGATIMGDGTVVLILDVGGLWLTDDTVRMVRAHAEPQVAEAKRRRPLIMVVDDSLTVRKVTSRHLQKHNMDVLVAKDGLDALEQLREQAPDVMLVDIEMPRMDGYELTTSVRSDSRLKHIPIIMITSRAGSKHRDRAMQLGVNLYMSKPYQEDELMRNINSMLPETVIH